VVVAVENGGEERQQVLAVEGQSARDEDVQQHAHAPHVDLGPAVLLLENQLGRGVGRRTAECVEQLTGHERVRQTKVNELDAQLAIEQQVLCFEVTVVLVGGWWSW